MKIKCKPTSCNRKSKENSIKAIATSNYCILRVPLQPELLLHSLIKLHSFLSSPSQLAY